MDVHTSKTKRTFAELQEKIPRDATAGSMANPLHISGASLAGKIKHLSFIELGCVHFCSRVRVTGNILPAMHLHVYMRTSYTRGI